MKQARKYFLIALGIIALDQIVKIIVKLNMVMGQAGQIKILGNFFKLYFIENNGAAFGFTISNMIRGMGGDMSEETGKLILSVFSIIAVIAIAPVKNITNRDELPPKDGRPTSINIDINPSSSSKIRLIVHFVILRDII